MRKIYLPNLKKIKIQNFSLYPNGLDFEYNFVSGVNLIFGGNGMGKTTFVNLIKYAIIGNYKKSYDFTRTYLGKKIEKRQELPLNYYKNRLDKTIILEKSPCVTIEFEINNDYFIVERLLDDIRLNSLILNNKKVEGKLISQNKYEQLSQDEKNDYLCYKYEQKISEVSGITFDDLIFFVNEILFFGENHRTILWNNDESNVQNELFNKYFNEPELDLARLEAIRQAKYFDSLSRHKSEDIRAITKVLKKIETNDAKNTEDSLESQVLALRNEIEILEGNIETKHLERNRVDDKIKQLNNEINIYCQKEAEIENSKKTVEREVFGKRWNTLHKNYDLYIKDIKTNETCPMCSQNLVASFIREIVINSSNCFLCKQEITESDSKELDKKLQNLSEQLIEIYNTIANGQKQLIEEEKVIKELDMEFRSLATQKRELQSKLRKLEHTSQNTENSNGELQAFYDEIDKLQSEKDENQEKSKSEKLKAEEISLKIEQHIRENTMKFSNLFSGFAEKFLGVDCSLTFANSSENENKRFYPVINGTTRYTEEEMSESQRFFVDHSFRMSILSFFYQKPTFYIVETPNSSLDISYEKNAADVFVKFLEKPNSLIITTNLNNSEFLQHLIETAENVSYVDLLDIGKKSDIQNASESMKLIANEIKNKINHGR